MHALRLTTATTTTVLRPLYGSTCVSRYLQLRTGVFCWCRVLLPACPCWWQPAHSDQGKDAGVLVNSVIYTLRWTCRKHKASRSPKLYNRRWRHKKTYLHFRMFMKNDTDTILFKHSTFRRVYFTESPKRSPNQDNGVSFYRLPKNFNLFKLSPKPICLLSVNMQCPYAILQLLSPISWLHKRNTVQCIRKCKCSTCEASWPTLDTTVTTNLWSVVTKFYWKYMHLCIYVIL